MYGDRLKTSRYRPTLLDIVLLLMLAAAGGYLVYRIRIGLNYSWNWAAIPQFLVRFDAESARWVPNVLLQGLLTTIRLSLWATVLATIIGVVMGMFRVSPVIFRRMVARSYVELTRNMPPLVLVFIFYYFISAQMLPSLGIEGFVRSASEETRSLIAALFAPARLLSPFLAGLAALAMFEGAYITEIVRAGIQSIGRGQWEAASALGFTRGQSLRHIILPRAIRRILPPLAGQFISTIKDSAIVSVISIQELTFQGLELMASTHLTFEIWITITGLYLLLTLSCAAAVGRIEFWMGSAGR
ncbi:MAG: amino acid ABC transporter permease [Desulfobacterales bacterium]|nr:amino acid ABC transporter permease [Desulfobacterales bacterium]